MNSIHDEFRRLGLTRPTDDKVLGGVLAGIGRRVGLDPWPTRIAATALLLAIPGTQILLYPALWALMPTDAPQPAGPVATEEPVILKPAHGG
jgi:phage shock protein C